MSLRVLGQGGSDSVGRFGGRLVDVNVVWKNSLKREALWMSELAERLPN